MFRSSSGGSSSRSGSDDAEQLRKNRLKKRRKFAWLSRFLSRGRPSKKELVDKGVLRDAADQRPLSQSVNKYFGVPLPDVYADARLIEGSVPRPVLYCCQAVQKFLDLQGLFRVSGTFSEMATLKSTFERGEIPDFSAVDNKHSVSGLLELYFRELPEPATTHALYDDFMTAVEAKDDEKRRLDTLRSTVAKLPAPNKMVLGALLHLLKQVADLCSVNQMDERNLGIVFGSILLGAEQLQISLAMKQKLQDQSTVVQYLIRYVHELFEGGSPPKAEVVESPLIPEDGDSNSAESE